MGLTTLLHKDEDRSNHSVQPIQKAAALLSFLSFERGYFSQTPQTTLFFSVKKQTTLFFSGRSSMLQSLFLLSGVDTQRWRWRGERGVLDTCGSKSGDTPTQDGLMRCAVLDRESCRTFRTVIVPYLLRLAKAWRICVMARTLARTGRRRW
jgi:hypothetical protein